jgi:hypothetical protein
VEAFNGAEKVLGRAWIEAARVQSGRLIQGTWPTLNVAMVGQLLSSVEGGTNADELIEKLRGGDKSAFAELEAVHAVRSKVPSAIIEFGPEAQVGDRKRKPDFRTRCDSGVWTYVEVTQPDIAEAHERAQRILNRLVDVVPIKKSFASTCRKLWSK